MLGSSRKTTMLQDERKIFPTAHEFKHYLLLFAMTALLSMLTYTCWHSNLLIMLENEGVGNSDRCCMGCMYIAIQTLVAILSVRVTGIKPGRSKVSPIATRHISKWEKLNSWVTEVIRFRISFRFYYAFFLQWRELPLPATFAYKDRVKWEPRIWTVRKPVHPVSWTGRSEKLSGKQNVVAQVSRPSLKLR